MEFNIEEYFGELIGRVTSEEKPRDLIEQSHKKNLLKTLLNVLFAKDANVLVLGMSGVGKTQIIKHSLHEDKDKAQTPTQVNTKESHTVRDTIVKSLVAMDTRGETSSILGQQDRNFTINKFKGQGIINVVSYGYRYTKSDKGSKEDEANLREQVKKHGSLFKYLDEMSKLEIEALNSWINMSFVKNQIKWIITLINKMDLWHEKTAVVINYYKQGTYGKIIKDSVSSDINANHYVLPYCALVQNFPVLDPFHPKSSLDDATRNSMEKAFIILLTGLLNHYGN